MKYLKKHTEFFLEKKGIGTAKDNLEVLIRKDGSILKDSKRSTPIGYITGVNRGGFKWIIVDYNWEQNKEDIGEDQSEHEYIAGIDSNGFIVSGEENWKDNKLTYNGKVILDTDGNPWSRTKNPALESIPSSPEYTDLIEYEPIGWVNVKIDDDLIKRVKRFSTPLSRRDGVTGLRNKLRKLSNPNLIRGYKGDDFTKTVQQKISAITLLKYLQELKDKFNPTSSGFLFESFIGGLLDGEVPDDNRKADITHKGDTYQLKFNKWLPDRATIPLVRYYKGPKGDFSKKQERGYKSSHIEAFNDKNFNPTLGHRPNDLFCDYYIIALKQTTKIYIFILNKMDDGNKYSIKQYLTPSGLSIRKLRDDKSKANVLDLKDIDSNLEKIGKDLKESLGSIWNNLSEIEYNVETITTGVDKNKKVVDVYEYESLYKDSKERLKIVESDLDNLSRGMKMEKDNQLRIKF